MPPRPDDDELEIRRYLHIVWSRKSLLILAVVAFVAASIAYDFIAKPVYRASTDVLLQGTAAEQVLTPTADGQRSSSQFDKARVETEIAFIQSGTVEKAVETAVGGHATVSVEQNGDSDVVTVSSSGTDADRAATVAQTYAETYIRIRREQLVKNFQDAAAQVQQQIDSLDK